jgi:N-acetylornithine carbamoyltransferase
MKQVPLQHFLNTQDWTRAELDAVLALAADYKRQPFGTPGMPRALEGKSIALVFFNSSLRTRTSFEIGAFQLGGHAVVLQPGKDAWPIEFDLGTVMDGETEEHIAEVARVLSRYVDLIGVRAFPKFVDWSVDRQDRVLKGFAKYSSVPVINMETITHPCQELAHILALQEHFGTSDLRGKKYVLTWTYHPKPLNTAVANSALTIATRMGMDVTLLCPTPSTCWTNATWTGPRRTWSRAAARCRSATTSTAPTAARTWCTPRAGARCRTSATGRRKSHPRRAQALHRRRRQDGADQ